MRIDNNKFHGLWTRIVTANDAAAFRSLFNLFHSPLIKFSQHFVHSREAAEEIVSDVFVYCWINRSSMGHVENPATYFFIAVKNRSLNYAKKFSSMQIIKAADDSVELVNTFCPQQQLELRELTYRLDKAVEALPDQCKLIFRMVKENGMKYKEVATVLGISPKTVHTQLYRAIKKLSAALDQVPRDPSPT